MALTGFLEFLIRRLEPHAKVITPSNTEARGCQLSVRITGSPARLRVDVHDTARSLPVTVDAPGDAEAGRGLKLVAAFSAEWGYYCTPAGKAMVMLAAV